MRVHTIRRRLTKAFMTLLAFLVVMVAITPNLWLALTSLKTERDAFAMPPQLIFRPIPDNYVTIFSRFNFDNYLLNSLIVGLLSDRMGPSPWERRQPMPWRGTVSKGSVNSPCMC